MKMKMEVIKTSKIRTTKTTRNNWKSNIPNVDCINTSLLEVSKIICDNLKKSIRFYCGIPGKFLGLTATPISFSMSQLFL